MKRGPTGAKKGGDDVNRRAVLYTGMRLDGSIADRAGGAGWMAGTGRSPGAGTATPIFTAGWAQWRWGGRTHRQIAEELSPGRWPYPEKESFVLTRRQSGERRPLSTAPRTGRSSGGGREGDIWVCGGAELARRLAAADCIDRYHLSVLPSLLGEGLSLFGGLGVERPLRLVSAERYNGIVDLVYERRGEAALL